MRQLNLFIGGMSCRRCVRDVTARLRDVPGVETISADPGDCLVRLSGSMQLADVLVACTGTTYRPELDDTKSSDRRDSGRQVSGSPRDLAALGLGRRLGEPAVTASALEHGRRR